MVSDLFLVPKIWVDGDSCVKRVRDYLCAKSNSRDFEVFFVSDRHLNIPTEQEKIHFIQVSPEPDAADSYILGSVDTRDLVITRDIPLARELVQKQILVMNDMGIIHTSDTIEARFRERNTKQELREQGLLSEGKKTYSQGDFQHFCRSFDVLLTKMKQPGSFSKNQI